MISANSIFGLIYTLAGIFCLGIIVWIFIRTRKNTSKRRMEGKELPYDAWQRIESERANAENYIEDQTRGLIYTNELGNRRLFADPNYKGLNVVLIAVLAIAVSFGSIFFGLSKLLNDRSVLRSIRDPLIFIVLAVVAYLLIEVGKGDLKMRYNKYEESDARWLKGHVILTEKKMGGYKNKKEMRTITVMHSMDGTVRYIHKDQHAYAIKKCPKLGDEIDILFSPTLKKALTKEEIKDAKHKVFMGVLFLFFVLLYIGIRLYKIGII